MDEKRRPLPEFEFDGRKSRLNKLKHGIDFVEAQALWLDEDMDEYLVEHANESRSVVIGRIGIKFCTAVVRYRGDNLRPISVRRSRVKEVEQHES